MKELTEQYQQHFSDLIHELWKDEKWDEIITILNKEIIKYPKEYWLYTTLSEVYFIIKKYEESYYFAEKAMQIQPKDMLVVYNYGHALSKIGKHKEAIVEWDKILNKNIEDIAYGKYGEGLRWAKSMINDARFEKASSLISLGKKSESISLIREHLAHRQRGLPSYFTKNQVLRTLSNVGNVSD